MAAARETSGRKGNEEQNQGGWNNPQDNRAAVRPREETAQPCARATAEGDDDWSCWPRDRRGRWIALRTPHSALLRQMRARL